MTKRLGRFRYTTRDARGVCARIESSAVGDGCAAGADRSDGDDGQREELDAVLRKTYGIPLGLPSPQWLLEIGAKLIGTETELVLKSRWVNVHV